MSALFESASAAEKAASDGRFGGFSVEPIDEGWSNSWIVHAKSVVLAEGCLVIPDVDDHETYPDGTGVLRIDPSETFGYGSHPTTRICAALLKQYAAEAVMQTQSVLDIGCGSGILSLYASVLGAKKVTGIDSDPLAVAASIKNAERNGIGNCTFLVSDIGGFSCRRYGVTVANIPIGALCENLDRVLENGKTERHCILSGFMYENAAEVRCMAEKYGTVVDGMQLESWMGYRIVVERSK